MKHAKTQYTDWPSRRWKIKGKTIGKFTAKYEQCIFGDGKIVRECHSLFVRRFVLFCFGNCVSMRVLSIDFHPFFYSCRSSRYFIDVGWYSVYTLSCLFRFDEGRLKIKWPILLSRRFVFSSLHTLFFRGCSWEWEALIRFFSLLLLIRVFIFRFYFQPKSKGERSHSTKIWYHYFESTAPQRRWIGHRKHGINNRAASRIDCTFHFLNAKHAIQLRQLARCVRCFSWYIRFVLYLIAFLSTVFFSQSFYFPYLVKRFCSFKTFFI